MAPPASPAQPEDGVVAGLAGSSRLMIKLKAAPAVPPGFCSPPPSVRRCVTCGVVGMVGGRREDLMLRLLLRRCLAPEPLLSGLIP